MTEDLVAALRDYNRHDTDELMDKAAEEIDRLRAELEEKNSVIRTMDGGIDFLRECQNMQERNLDYCGAEIDRLQEELEEARQYIVWHSEAVAEGLDYLKEIESLRTENAELRKCADAAITDKFKEIAKVERLREETEELRKALEYVHDLFPTSKACVILARTAKEEQ